MDLRFHFPKSNLNRNGLHPVVLGEYTNDNMLK